MSAMGSPPPALPPSWDSSYAAETFVCGSRAIPYLLRRSRRARSMRLSVQPGAGLIATLPHRHALEALQGFMRRHERWIVSQVEALERRTAQVPRRWPFGETLPYRGEEHRVIFQVPAPASGVERTGDRRLLVRLRRATLAGATRALKRWYLDEAWRAIVPQTARLADALGVTVVRVAVRDQRRRWGSCSARGCLNFNYRLIMAPPPVMEYVILHELTHRREMNHSPRFWRLVASRCPAYQASRAWLRLHGPYLPV